jgi:CHAT domain-containing protein
LLAESGGQPGILDLNSFATPGHAMCRLAVLSACQTSATSSSDEWDPDTLIRTLHRYGVPAVVASRWSVDSAVTAELMKRFYEYLLTGNTVEIGLQRASLVTRGQPDASHPYYWAAFASFQ